MRSDLSWLEEQAKDFGGWTGMWMAYVRDGRISESLRDLAIGWAVTAAQRAGHFGHEALYLRECGPVFEDSF